jgi:putative CocE/NonD family hydrolase
MCPRVVRCYTASMKSLVMCLVQLLVFTAWAQTAEPPQTWAVTMRDGIHLATDVYGADPNTRKPALLMRTPYDRHGPRASAERLAMAGYAVVLQDTRGASASEGKYIHYNNDDQDGFDTIEWIARQPWSNGKVGMWGTSHPGEVQWMAAGSRPPSLVAIAPTAAASSLYHIMYQGGALRLALLAAGAALRVNPPPTGVTPPTDFTRIHEHLPLSTLDDAIGWPMPWLEGIIAHNRLDGYWRRTEITPELGSLKLAVQNIVGYYDLSCNETIDNFLTLPDHGRKQLILGPWDHATIGKQLVAGLDFGPQAKLDTDEENLAWFDRFLKSAEGLQPFSPVRYFQMGDNVWRTSAQWPPANAVSTAFYLHSSGKANTRAGNGLLTRQEPGAEPADVFESDPDRPVPSEPAGAPQPSRATPWRPVDRASIEDRFDVLVYTAAIQKTSLTIAGRILADLWVSVNAPDADWAVKVIDVAPDGVARGVAEGILRSSGRDPVRYPALLEPGRRYHLRVEVGSTAATILPGHALRIEISGSAFPMFDRNLHTGEGPAGARKQVALQTVYHRPNATSRVLLPVLNHAS